MWYLLDTSEHLRPAWAQVLKWCWILWRFFAEVHFHLFFQLGVNLHSCRVICSNMFLECERIWFLGRQIIQQGVHFMKCPDGCLAASRFKSTFNTFGSFSCKINAFLLLEHWWPSSGDICVIEVWLAMTFWLCTYLQTACPLAAFNQYNSLWPSVKDNSTVTVSQILDHTLHMPPLCPFHATTIWAHECN